MTGMAMDSLVMTIAPADYTAPDGRVYRVVQISGVLDPAALPVVGPPPGLVDALALPEPFATRLHNELHRRALWRYSDAARRHAEVLAALMAALKVDAQEILRQYAAIEKPQGE